MIIAVWAIAQSQAAPFVAVAALVTFAAVLVILRELRQRLPPAPESPQTDATAANDESSKADREQRQKLIREAIHISVTGADLSGLWLLDPYLEIELTLENGIELKGFINELQGNLYIGAIRCNLRPELKHAYGNAFLINGSDNQKIKLLQPVTSDMANELKSSLAHPGVGMTFDLWDIFFTVKGLVGRWPVQCLKGLSDDAVRIQGPILDVAMARNLVLLPLTLAHRQPTADTAAPLPW